MGYNNSKIIQVKEETLNLLLVFMSERKNKTMNPESYFKEIIHDTNAVKRYAKIHVCEIDKNPYTMSNDKVHATVKAISGCPSWWDSIQLFNDANSLIPYETVHLNCENTIRNKPIIAEKSFIVVNVYCKPEQHFSCMIK